MLMGLWWRGNDRRRKGCTWFAQRLECIVAGGLLFQGLILMQGCGKFLRSCPRVSLGIPMRTLLMFATQSRRIRCGKNVMSLQSEHPRSHRHPGIRIEDGLG